MNTSFVSDRFISASLKMTNRERRALMSQSERSQVKHFLNCRRYSKRGILPEQIHTIAILSAVHRDTENAVLRQALTVPGEIKEITISGVVVDSVKVAKAIVADAAPAAPAAPAVKLKAFCVECESGSEGFSLARNENGPMTSDRARNLEEPAREYARMNPGVKVRVIRSKPARGVGTGRAVLRFRYVSGKGIGTY